MTRVACPALLFLLVLGLLPLPFARAEAPSLAADGRVGVVVDRQGLVFVRPAGRQRWTPLASRGLVFPGDRLRTETRGAHALELRLKGGGRLTVGPGALLDVAPDGAFVLFGGEVEATGSLAAPVTVRGTKRGEVQAEQARWLKADREGGVLTLEAAPRWLTGYRGTSSDEWMGALLAQVDGKEVPLHVASYKVEVEILDQVARTTIEQAFVNDTDARLEGTFRFPLPAEASVSGFGLWIGGELVEADVVERERARQIYEDILKRKKDPGLLEWAGGNVFQARVFPIEPRSEKRVRLRYTEVLPLEGRTWRYRHALRSELLRQHPLRELALTVRVASTAPLAEVTCPTHPEASVKTPTPGTALVELSQRDVTPEKDFEVAGRLEATAGLTVVTHRRGEDSWFMLLLQPPDTAAAGWQRDLVPEGAPLDLIVALDTSGSVDEAARRASATFVIALLNLLGPQDRVRVLTFDTEVRWMAEAAKPADPDLTDEALRFLEARRSMGWTDLDAAFDALARAAGAKTQVVIVTDGIGTSGDADPVALAQRLRSRGASSGATFHAVAPSSTYEKPVLEALASIGGGSVRHLKEDPAGVAQRLLTEAALPLVKDLKVEVEGLATARVYPEALPNLPVGSQHAVLGRFRPTGTGPTGTGATGTVVVSGTLEGKPVRFTAPLQVPGDQEGNSFLPRLWARRHLDALLAQGDARAVKDDIVRLSTEYGILTPYTSLLVLESDEDRAQYGVERRVQARDGEVEFATARDQVALEALRQATREAKAWRVGLRRRMLAEINGLGRDLHPAGVEMALGELAGAGSTAFDGDPVRLGDTILDIGGVIDQALTDFLPPTVQLVGPDSVSDEEHPLFGADADGEINLVPSNFSPPMLEEGEDTGQGGSPSTLTAAPCCAPASPPEPDAPGNDAEPWLDDVTNGLEDTGDREQAKRVAGAPALRFLGGPERGRLSLRSALDRGTLASVVGVRFPPEWLDDPGERLHAATTWTALGFPEAGRAVYDPLPPAEPPQAEEVLLRLLRRALGEEARGDLALNVVQRVEQVHPVSGRTLGASERRWLRSPDRWFLRFAAPGAEALEVSLDGGVATSLATGRRLARAWNAGPQAALSLEALRALLGLPTLRLREGARVREVGREGALLRLAVTRPPHLLEEEWLLDVDQGFLLERRFALPGQPLGRTVYADPVDLGGSRWPTRVESRDARDRLVTRSALALSALAQDAVAPAFALALAGREDVLTLGPNLPSVRTARQRLASGEAGFAERLVLALERANVQRHAEAWTHAEAALAQVAAKPGSLWVRAELLALTRRGADLRALLTGDLSAAARARPEQAWPLARRLLGIAQGSLGADEVLALVEALTPVVTGGDGPARDEARWAWGAEHVGALARAGRAPEARALIAARARERPYDLQAVRAAAQDLAEAGDPDGACAYLSQRLEGATAWSEAERDALEVERSERMAHRRRLGGLEPLLRRWAQERPDQPEAWQRHVSVLYLLGREAEADAWIERALTTLGRGEAFPATEQAQVKAALRLAFGRGWGWSSGRLEPRWQRPLADLALALGSTTDQRLDLAGSLLEEPPLPQTGPGREARERLVARLAEPEALRTLPLRQVAAWMRLSEWGPDQRPAAEARRALEALAQRLEQVESTGERGLLVDLMERVLDARGERDALLGVLEAWERRELGRSRAAVRERWLEHVLSLPHSAEREASALALLARLTAEAPLPLAERAAAYGGRLRDLVTWALEGRRESGLGTPEERKARTRAQARGADRDARRAARSALAAVLAASPATGDLEGAYLTLERLALRSENGEDLAAVVEGALPLAALPPGADPEEPLARVRRDVALRALVLLAHAATRREAPPELAGTVLAHLRALPEDGSLDPRYQVVRLLLALDRVAELETTLRTWAAEPVADPRWVRMSAYLEAEVGRIAPAAALLEPLLGEEGALEEGDLAALARWLLVLGEDRRRAQALKARYEAMDEWRLAEAIQAEARAVAERGPGGTGTLDPEVQAAIAVLMRKARWPGNHAWSVHALYAATKDGRVLAGLVEGLPGHSPGALYGLLETLQGLIADVHEEAALDALRGAVDALAPRAHTPGDRRAVALVRAFVEVRASQVLLADPSPGRRARAALEATAGPLEAGEVRPLAALLGSLPWSPDSEAGQARLTRLEELAQAADVPSGDRLAVVSTLATTLHAAQRTQEALDRLGAALREARASGAPSASEGLPAAMEQCVELEVALSRYAAAEARLREAWASPSSPLEKERLTGALMALYPRAVRAQAALSLGRGEALVREAMRRIEATWAREPNLASAAHQAHIDLFEAARETGALASAGPERVAFARDRLPGLLSGSPSDVDDAVGAEAQALHRLAGPREALRFLLDRVEREPTFARRVGEDVWSEHRWQLATWRAEAEPLLDLEPRLLALVLRHLVEAIERDDADPEPFWTEGSHGFWPSRLPDLLARALQLAEQAPSAPARQRVVAWHLVHMGRWEEAISLLEGARARGALDEAGETDLLNLLVQHARWAQALPALEAVLARAPEAFARHLQRVLALAGLGRREAALTALTDLRTRFAAAATPEATDRLANLGQAAQQAGLNAQGVDLLAEAVARAQAEGRGRAISGWRRPLALALSALGRTREALEQAALVALSEPSQARSQLAAQIGDDELLEQTLLAAPDLAAATRAYESDVAASGADAPLIRRALARVHRKVGDTAACLRQLEALLGLVPGDVAVLKLLVETYDASGERAKARATLEALVRAAPGEMPAWEDLGRRAAADGDAAEAERAHTGAVEARPLEPDGHRLLAKVRAAQGRHAEAATQWRLVTRARPLEPEGRLGEARAWIAAGQPARARPPLEEVVQGTWEASFGDVKQEAAELLAGLR